MLVTRAAFLKTARTHTVDVAEFFQQDSHSDACRRSCKLAVVFFQILTKIRSTKTYFVRSILYPVTCKCFQEASLFCNKLTDGPSWFLTTFRHESQIWLKSCEFMTACVYVHAPVARVPEVLVRLPRGRAAVFEFRKIKGNLPRT